jgi:hypothetical protein
MTPGLVSWTRSVVPFIVQMPAEIVGDECRLGGRRRPEELVQDLAEVAADPAGLVVGDAVDAGRVGRNAEPLGADDVAAGLLRMAAEIVTGPGQLDEVRPVLGDFRREIASAGQAGRLAIEEYELAGERRHLF